MADVRQAPSWGARRRRGARSRGAYAALDLGTNNCRLLIAQPAGPSFHVVDGFSRIVRLGEGLAASGRLSEAAMRRTLDALKACAEKIGNWPIAGQRCIATQACRAAENGPEFLDMVQQETGLSFAVISPQEEAELSVLGCASLIDPDAQGALVVDIGGGSTELSWVEGRTRRILAWTSLPFGVVTLAERYGDAIDDCAVYAEAVAAIRKTIAAFSEANHLKPMFARGHAHFLGTSGAVTSLAAVMLALPRYKRALVDGVWMSVDETRRTAEALRLSGRATRAGNACIGPERADLVVPGAAILEALFAEWPAGRVRVADRGLREGVLITLMARARRAG